MDYKERILDCRDSEEVCNILSETFGEITEVAASAGVACVWAFDIDDKMGNLTWFNCGWKSGLSMAIGLCERAKARLTQRAITPEP